eukprot:2711629-Rhodomonas_salina.1
MAKAPAPAPPTPAPAPPAAPQPPVLARRTCLGRHPPAVSALHVGQGFAALATPSCPCSPCLWDDIRALRLGGLEKGS